MTQDLTKITTPYGLLDEATQKALKEHGAPIEYYSGAAGWEISLEPCWCDEVTYRVKPQPPKPREWWVHPTKGWSISFREGDWRDTEWVHVREVIE
jgi:hypothetical protein